MDKLRILFVIKRPGIGGVQTYVKILSSFLESNDVVSAIYVHYPDYLEEMDSFKAFKVHTLTRNKAVLVFINVLSALATRLGFDLKKYLIKWHFNYVLSAESITVVHLNTDTTDYLLPIIKQKGIKLILTLHGIYKDLYLRKYDLDGGFFKKEVDRLAGIFGMCDKITYFSDDNLYPFQIALNKSLKKDRKVIKLLNPYPPFQVDDDLIDRPQSRPVRFALFGRGFESKGWGETLLAFKTISELGYNAELHFYGEGHFLEELIKKTPPIKGFYYHGKSLTVIKEMKNIDVGLVPSYHEEMPFIIIEYLACGVPVIASSVGEIPAMLCASKNNLAGWLLPLKNNKPNQDFFVKLMMEICDGKYDLATLRRNALDAFAKFNIKKIGASYLNLYQVE